MACRKYVKLLLVIVLMICAGACTDTNNDKLMLSEFPDADAVFIDMKKIYQLNIDGTIDFNYKHRLKYLTHYSFHRAYGETFIVYNPMYQQLTINKCNTEMADGETIETPENAFNEVLPRFAQNSAAYNHIREMVVTHTGLEKNAIAELDYSLKSSDDYLPFLSGRELFSASSPIKNYELIIRIPTGTSLKYQLQNTSAKPEITSDEEWTSYSWKFSKTEARSKESNQAELEPQIFFSTAPGMAEAKEFVAGQEAFRFKSNELLQELAAEECRKEKSQLEKAICLQQLVVDKVNYIPVSFGEAAFRCRTADEVWSSNNGTRIEKTILLVSLLRAAGIQANPVSVKEKGIINDSIGAFQYFTNFYVQVIPESENLTVPYLSAIAVNEPYELSYSELEIVSFDKEIKTLSHNAEKGSIVAAGEFSIGAAKGVKGSVNVKYSLSKNPFGKLTTNKEKATELFPGAKSCKQKTLDIGAAEVDFEIHQKESVKEQADYLFWDIPFAKNGFESLEIPALTEKRDSPLELDQVLTESYDYLISLPRDYTAVSQENSMRESNKTGSVTIELRKEDKNLRVIRKLSIENRLILPEDYEDFRKIMLLWNHKNYRQLILKKITDV